MHITRLVVKFGGTSVGSADAMKAAAAIVTSLKADIRDVIVVTSAMSGVTDTLLHAARAATTGQIARIHEMADTLRRRHHEAAAALVADAAARAPIVEAIDARIAEFSALCDALAVLGEASPRALDAVSSLGERMSVHLLAGAIRAAGRPAEPIDAAEVIRTDAVHQAAVPNMEETRELAADRLGPLCEDGVVPVVTGFIGSTPAGVVTTLGRGGSDYSAAILGAALDADEIWIYTDVDGVMTADPRVVENVRSLESLSYREMSELAYFGAKVLHPKTVTPALERGIPIRIKNTFNPSHPGTLVVGQTDGSGNGILKGVTAIHRQSLITIEGRGMLGVHGIAARAFGSVAATRTSVSMISQSSSEQSICFIVPQESADRVLDALRTEFATELARRDIESCWALNGVVIVTVVGVGIRATPGIAGRVFGALGNGGINVLAIAMGSSECSISLVVDAKDADEAVRRLHTLIEP